MTIRFYQHLQAFKCVCGKTHEVMSRTVKNPDAMLELTERLREEHRHCGGIANAGPTLKPCAAIARP